MEGKISTGMTGDFQIVTQESKILPQLCSKNPDTQTAQLYCLNFFEITFITLKARMQRKMTKHKYFP